MKVTMEEDSEAGVKKEGEAGMKKEGEGKNLTEKQTVMVPVKNNLKSRPCALGLKRLRRLGRREHYKGPAQDGETPLKCFNPFMQGMPFGGKNPLPR